jgi:hypothetical protein
MKSIESDTGKMMEAPAFYQSEISFSLKKFQWAAARLLFMASMIFGTATIIGFYLLAPLYSYWFFGTFRFWRHLGMWPRLIAYGYYFAYIPSHDPTEPERRPTQSRLESRIFLRRVQSVLP